MVYILGYASLVGLNRNEYNEEKWQQAFSRGSSFKRGYGEYSQAW